MDPQPFNSNSRLRASDADRDRAATVLNEALAVRPDAAPARAPGGSKRSTGRLIAIFGGATRKGAWHVPENSTAVTIFGGADIDLREAVLPAREITITAVSVFGGVGITVPPETRGIASGFAFSGPRDPPGDTPGPPRPDAPVLHLKGACVFGGIGVK